MRGWPALVVLLIAGCAPTGSGQRLPDASGLTIVPGPEGLLVEPVGREIGFGRHQDGAISATSRILGRSPDAVRPRPECPASARTEVVWARDGLTLVFDAEGSFVGWSAGGGRTFQGPQASAGRLC